MIRILKQERRPACDIFTIGEDGAQYVVQVVDRQSDILQKHITETKVWPFVAVGPKAGTGASPAFWAVATAVATAGGVCR
ncbi:hypothetical protein B7R22_16940 [Subtercola boreus]|uniref:Uncharacterized protein n=1 Tax=Subtercola boreus TaxID=120213 RepID=A0A3E0VT99_9MICO|nr:hypothetical protein [Subtercola boreus]RFA12117.1 hypothetical protein B7R22_16940 [Subtercola boreus]